MSKKSTRATKIKDDPDSSSKQTSNPSASALRKIFYISEDMLEDGTQKLNLEYFYHPGKGKKALFITKDDTTIMEVMEYSEPRRSWLINSEICSNGHIYMTTPIDVTFLALHHLHKHCQSRAISLDNIHDDADPSVTRLLNNFVRKDSLKCIADVKTAGKDNYYKYNHEKCLAWLSLKTKRVADALKKAGVHCGHSAVSQNYTRSENATDESAHETDYLRMACDYVGGYVSLQLHEELTKLLQIPSEIQAKSEDKKSANTKRKSGESLQSKGTKKQKLENGAAAKLKNSSLLEESPDDDETENHNKNNSMNEEIIKSPKETISTPLKEKTLTAKEKSLAKSAKGTKSIASFFMKKATT